MKILAKNISPLRIVSFFVVIFAVLAVGNLVFANRSAEDLGDFSTVIPIDVPYGGDTTGGDTTGGDTTGGDTTGGDTTGGDTTGGDTTGGDTTGGDTTGGDTTGGDTTGGDTTGGSTTGGDTTGGSTTGGDTTGGSTTGGSTTGGDTTGGSTTGSTGTRGGGGSTETRGGRGSGGTVDPPVCVGLDGESCWVDCNWDGVDDTEGTWSCSYCSVTCSTTSGGTTSGGTTSGGRAGETGGGRGGTTSGGTTSGGTTSGGTTSGGTTSGGTTTSCTDPCYGYCPNGLTLVAGTCGSNNSCSIPASGCPSNSIVGSPSNLLGNITTPAVTNNTGGNYNSVATTTANASGTIYTNASGTIIFSGPTPRDGDFCQVSNPSCPGSGFTMGRLEGGRCTPGEGMQYGSCSSSTTSPIANLDPQCTDALRGAGYNPTNNQGVPAYCKNSTVTNIAYGSCINGLQTSVISECPSVSCATTCGTEGAYLTDSISGNCVVVETRTHSCADIQNNLPTRFLGGFIAFRSASIPTGDPICPASFFITPISATISVGGTRQFNATYDPDGICNEQAQYDVTSIATWTSNNSGVASVSSGGNVSGRAVGQANISATFRGENSSAPVFIVDNSTADYSIESSPAATSITRGGQSKVYTITIRPFNGFTRSVNLSVSSLPTGVRSTISPNSISPGQSATLTVWAENSAAAGDYSFRINGVSASPAISRFKVLDLQVSNMCSPTLTTIPPSADVDIGADVSFRAMFDSDGPSCPTLPRDVTTSTLTSWSSSNGVILQDRGSGVFRGMQTGSARAIAVHSGTFSQSAVSVIPGVCGAPILSITPTSQQVNLGDVASFRAMFDPDGSGASCPQPFRDVTNTATWESRNSSVATPFAQAGSFRALSEGSAQIRATQGSAVDTASLTVVRPQTCTNQAILDVRPDSQRGAVNDVLQFSAWYDADGNCAATNPAVDVTNSPGTAWQSNGPSRAASRGNGRFELRTVGTTTVQARYLTLSDSSEVIVDSPGPGPGFLGCSFDASKTFVIIPPPASVTFSWACSGGTATSTTSCVLTNNGGLATVNGGGTNPGTNLSPTRNTTFSLDCSNPTAGTFHEDINVRVLDVNIIEVPPHQTSTQGQGGTN